MRKFSIILLLLVAGTIALFFFRQPTQLVHHSYKAPVAESPLKGLSGFVDANMDRIFCPLSSEQTLMPMHELRQVQQSLKVLQSKAMTDHERRLYAAGVTLCTQVLDAIELRESHNRRLADMRKKGFVSALADPKNKEKEAKKMQNFFEAGVMRSWENQAVRARKIIETQYEALRLLERSNGS